MKKPSYILALDAGTTSNRAILFDHAGKIVSIAQQEFSQHYPQPGWVEHDAEEIWRVQLSVAREVLAKANITASEVAAIGITNQRETTVVWNRRTGRPIAPAIVWQCRRTAPFCDELRSRGLADTIREKTGLVPDAYFSGTKIRWILDNVPGARDAANAGDLLFGTIDTWLIWNLTGGRLHVTDYSNASRTMLFNIHDLAWDAELLSVLDIPSSLLPRPLPSSAIYGETDSSLFGAPIPIGGAGGDQQCALFGQACFSPGAAKNTYGTGCFMLMNTGTSPVLSQHGLLTTIAWGIGNTVEYALEGSVFVAGAAIQWLRDELHLIEKSSDSEALARSVPDTNGCYVVPAFTGLGAPYWDAYARGAILGLTRGVNRAHLVRATLESLAYQTADVLAAMEADAGCRLQILQVDGGAAANDFLMSFQSDLLGVSVVRPTCLETTAFGAASFAGLASGFWASREELASLHTLERTFTPMRDDAWRAAALKGWHNAVNKCNM